MAQVKEKFQLHIEGESQKDRIDRVLAYWNNNFDQRTEIFNRITGTSLTGKGVCDYIWVELMKANRAMATYIGQLTSLWCHHTIYMVDPSPHSIWDVVRSEIIIMKLGAV